MQIHGKSDYNLHYLDSIFLQPFSTTSLDDSLQC